MKVKSHDLDLCIELSEAISGAHIDKEKGIISGVVILTGQKESHNKTFYTPKALAEAKTRYEGAKMYLDHGPNGSQSRSVRDFGGTYKNLRVEENFLKADLHVSSSPSVRDIVFPLAESKAGGLSIRDRGKGQEKEGVFIVEGFAGKSFSIDLVTEPSVNKNLFESKEDDDMKWEDVKIEDLQKERPELVEQLKQEERKLVLEEVKEKIAKGENAESMLLESNKLVALSEAGFEAEIASEVKKMIMSKAVTLEEAKATIASQKTIIEKFGKSSKKTDPEVKGMGGKSQELGEGELPKESDILEALK